MSRFSARIALTAGVLLGTLITLPAAGVVDNSKHIDVNSIDCIVTNYDSYAHDVVNVSAGFVWPRGSGKTAVFAGGLWIAGYINDQTLPTVKVGEYTSLWGPGPIINGTGALDTPDYHVYKIRRGDTDANPDYAGWPAALGAPVDSAGNPLVLGDMTLWSIFNDRSPLATSNRAGTIGTDPDHSLGLEVQQTTFGISRPGPGDSAIFLKYRIINKGQNHLHGTYVTFWADPDLGTSSTDLVGCDSALSLGYVYDSVNGTSVVPDTPLVATYTPPGNDPFAAVYDPVSGNVGAGFSVFHTGADLARNFFGTSLSDSQLVHVDLVFDPSGGQHAYAYLRDASHLCSPNPNYSYQGFGTVPFKAFDVSDSAHPRQINVAFVQNCGDSTNTNPPRWLPDDSPYGGREYLFPLLSSYSDSPLAQYTTGASPSPYSEQALDALYAFWLRRASAAAGPKAGDVLHIQYGPPGTKIVGEAVYAPNPPSIGWTLCQGPLSKPGGLRLPLGSFVEYLNGHDPSEPSGSYDLMEGLGYFGDPIVDPWGNAAHFTFSGDPVAGTGWLDTEPGDQRLMLSAGPFEMDPGDTQEVAIAVVVGQGSDRLSSITRMKANALWARQAYATGFNFTTPVALAGLEGREGYGYIELEWTAFGRSSGGTVSIYRAGRREGPYARVSGLLPSGAPGLRMSFRDESIRPGGDYFYKIELQQGGAEEFAGPVHVQAQPAVLALSPPSPNPCAGLARIEYEVPARARVELSLYSSDGKRVRVLEDDVEDARFAASTLDTHGLAAGVYFLRLQSAGAVRTRRIVILK